MEFIIKPVDTAAHLATQMVDIWTGSWLKLRSLELIHPFRIKIKGIVHLLEIESTFILINYISVVISTIFVCDQLSG